jgi:hypothetical protein
MATKFTDEHMEQYERDGYTILRRLIPVSLLRELREMAAIGYAIAQREIGPQAQRLKPIVDYLDCAPYYAFCELPELREALRGLVGLESVVGIPPGDGERLSASILYQPSASPHCTTWHRDWRDNGPGIDINVWRKRQSERALFNQMNCALYEDGCTYAVPGSHARDDTDAEIELFPMRPIVGVDVSDMDACEAELACLSYVQSMPGAVQLMLFPGDCMIYRNSLWHIGTYAPYRKRATLHDYIWTQEYYEWCQKPPQRPDGLKTMMNPHEDSPSYCNWVAERDGA